MADFGLGNAPILNATQTGSNPGSGAVVADSGPVPQGGLYEVRVIAGASAAGEMRIERRNAANNSTVSTVVLYVSTQSAEYSLLYTLEASERIRVAMNAALTGVAAAAVQLELRS